MSLYTWTCLWPLWQHILSPLNILSAAAVAQWVRPFAPEAEGWVFKSQPRQTQVVKTSSDSSTAKRIRCECHGSSEMTIINGAPCNSRCGTLKNPHWSMVMSAEHRSKFGDVSKWVKHSRVGRKTLNKKKNKNILSSATIYAGTCGTYCRLAEDL